MLVLFVAVVIASASTAHAQFSTDERKCRETVSKNGQKLADTIAKTLSTCHKKRSAQKLDASTDCNSISEADEKLKVSKIAGKLSEQVQDKCEPMDPAALGYVGCPAPCDGAVPSIDNFQDVADCLICLIEDSGQAMSFNSQGDPQPLDLNKDEAKCHAGIGKNQAKHLKTILKERRKCQKEAEVGGATNTVSCEGVDPNGKIAKIRGKGEEKNVKKCDREEVNLGELGSCSDFSMMALNGCVFSDSESKGESTFEHLYGLSPSMSTTTTIPATTTTTTTVEGGEEQDPQCPDSGELVLYGGVRETACATNTDCLVAGALVGTCDTVLGRCVTSTDLDTGWTGQAQDADISDGVFTHGSLLCPGPFDGGSSEPCGECSIEGIDPVDDLCRCNSDNRTICDDTFGLDFDDCTVAGTASCTTDDDCRVCRFDPSRSCTTDDDCSECTVSGIPCGPSVGGCPPGEGPCINRLHGHCLAGILKPTCSGGACVGRCDCIFGPPLALSAGLTPACVINKFAQDISGTANVDLGAGEITANLSAVVFLGELVTVPCPYCTGDTTPRDGVRDGTCVLGLNDGESCDVQAPNLTFPAPGGDGHSIDCFPEVGKNVSGSGLSIAFVSTTGVRSMSANIECGFPPFSIEQCPCGVCSNSSSTPCQSDADCSGGTCQAVACDRERVYGRSRRVVLVEHRLRGAGWHLRGDRRRVLARPRHELLRRGAACQRRALYLLYEQRRLRQHRLRRGRGREPVRRLLAHAAAQVLHRSARRHRQGRSPGSGGCGGVLHPAHRQPGHQRRDRPARPRPGEERGALANVLCERSGNRVHPGHRRLPVMPRAGV
jgi:hypothetical protein